MRSEQGAIFHKLGDSEELAIVGDLILSNLSLTRVWTANFNSGVILAGSISVSGHLSMAGALELVDLNGSPENLTVAIVSWNSSSGYFSDVTIVNVTTEPCENFCLQVCSHPPPRFCSPECGDAPAMTFFDCLGLNLVQWGNYTFNCSGRVYLGASHSDQFLPPASGCTSYGASGLTVLFSGTQECGECGYSWTNWPKCDVPICEPVASDLSLLNKVPLCNGNGACLVSNAEPSCHCDSGYTGTACDVADCSANPCEFGTCELGGLCKCQSNWQGSSCSIPKCPNDCSNNGECIGNPDGSTTCHCDARFLGDDCSIIICPGVVNEASPRTTSCNEQGTCNEQTGQCTCDQGWTGSDCSQKCSSSSCPEFSCPLGCSGGGNCVWPGVCSCDDNRIGTICQWKVCLPSSRAVFFELSVDILTTSGSPIDAFMNSNVPADQIAMLANLTNLQPADICLTAVELAPDPSSPIHLFASRSTDTIVYPIYALDPIPVDPLDCNTTCPEAEEAQAQLNAALDAAVDGQALLGALGYAWLTIAYADLCDNCSYPHGYCRFGVCICDEWWNAPVSEVPRPPPTCAYSSCPGDCYGRGTCVLLSSTQQAWCNCSSNATAGWAWSGEVCTVPICPDNCTGHGQCAGNADVPWCNCTFGFTGDECAVRKSLHSTASESTLLAYQIATGACLAGALLFVFLIAAVPPISRRFYGSRAEQIREVRKEIKTDRKFETKQEAFFVQTPNTASPGVAEEPLRIITCEEDMDA